MDDDDDGDADDPNIVYAAEINLDEGDLSLEDLVNGSERSTRRQPRRGREAADGYRVAAEGWQHAMAGAFLDMKERTRL